MSYFYVQLLLFRSWSACIRYTRIRAISIVALRFELFGARIQRNCLADRTMLITGSWTIPHGAIGALLCFHARCTRKILFFWLNYCCVPPDGGVLRTTLNVYTRWVRVWFIIRQWTAHFHFYPASRGVNDLSAADDNSGWLIWIYLPDV